MTSVNEKTETEVILGEGSPLHLPAADIDVIIEELGTRQFFKFLKILTVGAGPALADLVVEADTDVEELTGSLIALLLVSIPEAEDEVIDFIKSMVKPVGIIDPERSKVDRQKNVDLYTELYRTLDNPKPEDSLEILIRVVENETPNLVALGKRVAALLPTAAKAAKSTGSSKKPSKKSTPEA